MNLSIKTQRDGTALGWVELCCRVRSVDLSACLIFKKKARVQYVASLPATSSAKSRFFAPSVSRNNSGPRSRAYLGFCRRFEDSSQTAQECPIKLGKFLLLNLKRKAASRFIVEICGFDVSSQFFVSADSSMTVKQTFYEHKIRLNY